MPIGVRELSVLGEFKPFGLVAEALDGEPTGNLDGDYRYSLFGPEVTKQRDDADKFDDASPSGDGSDHELFIRGNRSVLHNWVIYLVFIIMVENFISEVSWELSGLDNLPEEDTQFAVAIDFNF